MIFGKKKKALSSPCNSSILLPKLIFIIFNRHHQTLPRVCVLICEYLASCHPKYRINNKKSIK